MRCWYDSLSFTFLCITPLITSLITPISPIITLIITSISPIITPIITPIRAISLGNPSLTGVNPLLP